LERNSAIIVVVFCLGLPNPVEEAELGELKTLLLASVLRDGDTSLFLTELLYVKDDDFIF